MMMKKTILIAAFAAAGLVATPAVAKKNYSRSGAMTCAKVAPAQIEAQFAKFNDAWATKDPAKVTSLFTKDAVLLATVSNTPRTTPAAINDYFVKFLANNPVGTINTSTVKIDCNTASRLGTWTVTFTDAAGVKTDVKARYSFIYKMEGDVWKIDHLHSSMMPEKTS
jgi:uncharacterized protein (TIGR02246 family)